jgi:hypothetical protein
MARTPIDQSANIFLQGSQLYQNANRNIFDAITNAANSYDAKQRQREAQLAAERLAAAEREAKQQAELLKQQQKAAQEAMKPENILAQAIQDPSSITPEQAAIFDANQRLQASKVALDPSGRAYKPYDPVELPTGISPAGNIMPRVKQGSTIFEGLAPPPQNASSGVTPSDYFTGSTQEAPSPIGQGPVKLKAPNTSVGQSPVGQMEEVKAQLRLDADIAKMGAEEEREKRKADFEKKKKLTTLNKSFGAMLSDTKNIKNKAKEAIKKSHFFNTGFFAGDEGAGLYGSGFLTGGKDLAATVKTLQADSAFSRLTELKEAGGTLGATSDSEIRLLGAARTNLEQSQSEEQFDKNLREYMNVRQGALRRTAEAFKADYGVYPEGYKPEDFADVEVSAIPNEGDVIDGWRFNGGDPSKRENWSEVQ